MIARAAKIGKTKLIEHFCTFEETYPLTPSLQGKGDVFL